ncbi:hypothetical protein AXF42_Ash008214 [Apostasia shenzhenica]|uniref:Protein GUCD1 n=1 Tax=Apostasia shenzhenica TaxID=1088818 RepID=A0A2I0A8Y7_9ASPA|nr:hypothetical protein AXF42_Ash008214 [Apostasia shenzhenica]
MPAMDEGLTGRKTRSKFLIFVALFFALCLTFDLEKLPLVDSKSKVSGVAVSENQELKQDEGLYVGRLSKLTAGLVMWPIYLIADWLVKMSGEGETTGGGDEAAAPARFSGVDACVSVPARSHFVDVPHVRQQFHWDCGLACVSMVLRTLGIRNCDIHHLVELCSTESVWTVDLAYLLNRFSVSFCFFTVTLGVDPNFYAQAFYKEQLQDDLGRVDGLFQKALEAGITIQRGSISGEEIACLISSGHYIAVALVDKIKLSGSQPEDGYISVDTSDYMGHYVVICGYDAETSEFELRDPASSRKYERASLACLDYARKCFGTDEDILLVFLNGKPQTSAPICR